jgi:hypothetical protein
MSYSKAIVIQIRYSIYMAKYNVPKRNFTSGPKKLVSYRLPEELLGRLEKVANDKGWSVTDVIITVLDQYVSFETKGKSKK